MDVTSFITGFAVAGFIGTIIECILTVKKDREIKSLQKEFVQATNQMSAAYKIPTIIYKDAKEFKFPSGSTNIKDDLQKAKDYAEGCNLQDFEEIVDKNIEPETNEIHFVEVKKIEFPPGDTDIKDGMQEAIDYATKNDCYVDFKINGCSLLAFEGIPIKLLIKEYNDYMKKHK